MGIEPTQPAWEAGTLPLSYTRIKYIRLRALQYIHNILNKFYLVLSHYSIITAIYQYAGKIFLKNLKNT